MKAIGYFKSRSTETERGCWEWTACTKSNGYGTFKDGTGMEFAHRGAWAAINGPIPSGLYVLHRCDNRRCVNPTHLTVGTQADNMADAASKGRTAHGSKVSTSKLKEHDVAIIKWCLDAGVKQRKLAALYGVAQSVIAKINTGKSWRRVHAIEYMP